jgi:N4-gp56 family major capsid protein
MTVQTTSNLTNSVRARYKDEYIEAAMFARVYDQLSTPVGKVETVDNAMQGSSVVVPFLSDLAPVEAVISQVADLNPVTLRDATASITPTSRANAIQWAQELDIKVYTDYGSKRFKAAGKNAAESIDLLAQIAALQGTNVRRPAARASLDAGTTTHRFSDTELIQIDSRLQALKCPYYIDPVSGTKTWVAIMHPDAYHDIRTGGNILPVGAYQDKSIPLNWELGRVGSFRLIQTAWAKVFGAAGADNASNVATTLSGAHTALSKTLTVASGTNVAAGMQLTIGTEETGNTFYPTNERVTVDDTYTSGTSVPIIGEGANGGLRFDHDSGAAVRNADNAYPIAFGSPMSLAKLYAPQVGEFGEVVGPKRTGLVDQFASVGWKFYGGYGRWVESWLVRGEYASSLQA